MANPRRRPRLLAAFLLFAALPPAQGETPPAPPMPDIRDAYGVAVADFDGDGLPDIYVVGFRTLNRLLVNNGDGTFRDRSIASGAGGNLMPKGVRNLELGAAAADFDNDGYVDILIAGWGDALELLHNRGDGTFAAVTKKAGILRDADANMAVFADLDRDGYLDLLLTNEHGPMRLYRNDHGYRFQVIPLGQTGLEADSGSQTAVFSDFDRDGDLDLAVAGWSHPLRLYEQVAPFRFKPLALPMEIPSGTRCNSVVTADLDNDGDFDLIATRRGARSYVLENQANPAPASASPADGLPAGGWPARFVEAGERWGLPDSIDAYAAVPADFDGDGDPDLFLTARGANHALENVGGRFEERSLPWGGLSDTRAAYSTSALAADLTSAPGPELFVAARDSACTLMESRARGSFLKVVPRGLYSNRNAVGASISLWGKEEKSWRLLSLSEVHGGEGYLSAAVGPVLFALPEEKRELRVRVAFPGGKVVTRRVPSGEEILEVWEGGFFAGAYVRCRQALYAFAHDPARLRLVLIALAALAGALAAMRWTVRRLAQNIARRKYLAELEGKNRELERLIGEVRRTQQQLIQSEKLAALGQLVAGIAHELNNPIGFIYANLHQIQGYLESLAAQPEPRQREALLQKARAALEESQEGSKRVRDIVQNLRGISRADSPRKNGVLEKKPHDLNQLLDKSLLLAQTTFSKSLEIQKNYAELPAVPCDATQIQQVFLNILVNAGQAMGETGTLRLRTQRDGGFLCATLSDSGPGVSPEHLGKLFEPFFTTKPVGQGLGLGLHISYDIVRAHGGTLEARSEAGKGAEFAVRLPLGEQ